MKTSKILISTLVAAAVTTFSAVPALATDLTWAGTSENHTWSTTDTNNIWKNGETPTNFSASDNVTFPAISDGTPYSEVTISSDVTAGTVSVNGGYTFKFEGTAGENGTTVKPVLTASSLSISGEGASLTLDGAGTLKLTSLGTPGNWSSLAVNENATLDLSGTWSSGTVDLTKVSGAGTLKLVNSATNHNATINLSNNFSGTFDYQGNLNWGTFSVSDNSSATLRFTSVWMWNGDASTSKTLANAIEFVGSESKITGSGNLTFTGAITGEKLSVGGGTVVFKGATTQSSMTLNLSGTGGEVKFSQKDGDETTSYTIGHIEATTTDNAGRKVTVDEGAKVTLAADNGNTATVNNAWGMSLTVNGELDVSAGTMNYATGNVTNVIDGSGTVKVKNFKTGNIGTYAISVAKMEIETANLAAGTTNFLSTANITKLSISGGTTNIGDGNTAATVKTERFVGADNANANGTLNVKANSVLNVTGTTDSNDSNSASFMIAHWGIYNGDAKQTLNVEGTLTINSGISTKDGAKGTINIQSGGEANFKNGLKLGGSSQTTTVNLAAGGRINVGTGGIVNVANLKLNISGGTIGSLADSWSSEKALALGGALTIDTAQKTVGENGKTTDADSAASITLSGGLSDAENATGSLEKVGTGTLTLSGANTFTGGVTVSAGKLVAAHASALGTGTTTLSGGQLSVDTNVSLSSSGMTIVLGDAYKSEGGTAAITGAGTLTLADNAKITLTDALDSSVAAFVADNAPDSPISFKILDSTIAGTSNTITADSFTLGGSYADKYSVSYASGVVTLSLVPEPSTFGLLAGLGALALVVSRRRRSRK